MKRGWKSGKRYFSVPLRIDSVARSGHALEDWSFGGGTVLMRRHHHRFSKDVDIFIPDPQYLNYLTPRLNNDVEILTTH